MSFDWVTSPDAWIALVTLTALEIVLGIDNIVFISILSSKLPAHQQRLGRQGGLALALISRILLLFSISWIVQLTAPLFTVYGFTLSGRDLILLVGGLFLVGKATYEIHERLEGEEGHGSAVATASLTAVLLQILMLDVVFSLDSVITAVGMVDNITIMIVAVVIAVVIMLVSAEPVSSFVNHHPTVKMLALAFLILIGMTLIADGFHHHIPKGYIYSAMGFSVLVEALNLLARRRKAAPEPPVHLRPAYAKEYLERGAETVPLPGQVNPLPVPAVVSGGPAGGRRQRRPRKRR